MNALERIEIIQILAAVNSNALPATKGQVRRLNIKFSELLPQNRSGKLSVISFIIGRKLSTTKDLNRKEIELIMTESELGEIVDYVLSEI